MTSKYRTMGEQSYIAWAQSIGEVYTQPPYTETYATGLQVTISEGNPYHLLGRTNSVDVGGPFDTTRVNVDLGSGCRPRVMRHYSSGGSFRNAYSTVAVPSEAIHDYIRDIATRESAQQADAFILDWRNNNVPSDSEMDAWGSTVINSVKPTNPTVDLAMSIGEFVSERKFFSLPGNAGSIPGEYLNYMFGIAPTISDIQDLRTAIEDKEKIIRQHVRNSGRRIRRRFDADAEVTSSTVVQSGIRARFFGPNPNTNLHTTGTLTTHTRKTQKWAFSGAFTYYLPEEGFTRDLALMDKLYGVKPGSALAWELVPFSWLVDYKTSMGDSLSNFDSFVQDGLVMPYAYVMCHTTVDTEYVWQGSLKDPGGNLKPETLVASITIENKRRRPATPFGFGILPGDLSARQLSIITALGLTTLSNK